MKDSQSRKRAAGARNAAAARKRAGADFFGREGLKKLLAGVRAGSIGEEEALRSLASFPFEETESATIDHHRALRKGFCEVIYCEGKTPAQVAEIAERLAEKSPRLLGTRAAPQHFSAAKKRVRGLHYDPLSRVLWLYRYPQTKLDGAVVVAAGTSDLPVAEEAAITLEVMGHQPVRIRDVGVAGLHRLLTHLPVLSAARVVIVAAGMEGALPSVVAGLIAAPVIAVPTSVGYGTAFKGVTALLAMLQRLRPPASPS